MKFTADVICSWISLGFVNAVRLSFLFNNDVILKVTTNVPFKKNFKNIGENVFDAHYSLLVINTLCKYIFTNYTIICW